MCCAQKLQGHVCVFVISTYVDGEAPESATWFCKWLDDMANDFRVSKTHFAGLKYAVIALGDSSYGENYCKVCILFGKGSTRQC